MQSLQSVLATLCTLLLCDCASQTPPPDYAACRPSELARELLQKGKPVEELSADSPIHWLDPAHKHATGMGMLFAFLLAEKWTEVAHYQREFGLTDPDLLKVILEAVKSHGKEIQSAISQGELSPKELRKKLEEHCGAVHRLAARFPRFPTLWEIAESCNPDSLQNLPERKKPGLNAGDKR